MRNYYLKVDIIRKKMWGEICLAETHWRFVTNDDKLYHSHDKGLINSLGVTPIYQPQGK